MGASGWDYYVPYQKDLSAALNQLRRKVFEAQDYYWEAEGPKPRRMSQLWQNELVQESGTHSILDMHEIVGPRQQPDFGTVQPLTPEEISQTAGPNPLTRAHVDALQPLASQRWFGRCAVLHDADGKPDEIYFWGFSGD